MLILCYIVFYIIYFSTMPKVNSLTLGSYNEFTQFVDKLPENGSKTFFYFYGKKKENGKSWCPYCELAEPVVTSYLEKLEKDLTFALVDVGDREYWKDKNCPFRTDPRSKLMVIPTIIKWKGVQRLEGSQCTKMDLLKMLFEEEE